MKRALGLAATLLVGLALAVLASRTPTPPARPSAADFQAGRAMADIAAIARQGHPIGSAEHARVRDYLLARLRALGLETRVQAAEAVEGRAFDAVALHDAEDVVHSAEIGIYGALCARFDLVQLPVLPLIETGCGIWRRFVSAVSADEFAAWLRAWDDACDRARGADLDELRRQRRGLTFFDGELGNGGARVTLTPLQYALLRDELAALVRGRAKPGDAPADGVLDLVGRLLDQARAVSLRGYRETREREA